MKDSERLKHLIDFMENRHSSHKVSLETCILRLARQLALLREEAKEREEG